MIPGVISTGLESWSTEEDQRQYFRKRLWGSWSMMRSLVLDKAGRNGQQGKPLGDNERLDQLQPGPLLWGKGGWRRLAVEWLAGSGIAVEFGKHHVPDGDERWVGVSCQ